MALSRGLPGCSERAARLDAADRESVLSAARRDRVSGFLWTAIEDGAVETDPATADAVLAGWKQELAGSVMVEALAVRTARLLDGAGVR
ncbi:MAG: hypothetical protein M3501_01650, partial [Actinomycetota bacterium]|nr:hypothetical protein [Actinomycetota bacterium]